MITALKDLFPRIDAWPPEDQEALVEAAHGIEAERTGVYQATADELGWRKGAPILGELNRFRTACRCQAAESTAFLRFSGRSIRRNNALGYR